MPSFYDDNDDLRWWVERGIDWAPLVWLTELGRPEVAEVSMRGDHRLEVTVRGEQLGMARVGDTPRPEGGERFGDGVYAIDGSGHEHARLHCAAAVLQRARLPPPSASREKYYGALLATWPARSRVTEPVTVGVTLRITRLRPAPWQRQEGAVGLADRAGHV